MICSGTASERMLRMVNAGTFSSGAALLSLGLSVPETLFAQSIGALLLVIGLTLNAAAGVKYLVAAIGAIVHRKN